MRTRIQGALHGQALSSFVALAALLIVWQVVAMIFFPYGDTLAGPTQVLRELGRERDLWWPNIVATMSSALTGLAIGVGIAVVLSAIAVLTRWTERVTLRVAAALYAMPIVAIGPLLQVRLTSAASSTVLAVFAVTFTALVSIIGGLHAADRSARDVAHAFGGTPLAFLWKVRIPYALPSIVSGFQIAYPAAIIGALIGEFLGAQSGLGVLVLSDLSQMQTASLYAAAAVITAVTAIGYYALGALARLCTRYVPATMGVAPRTTDAWWRRAVEAIATAVAVAVVLIAAWMAYLHFFSIGSFVGKGPGDVWAFLIDPKWAQDRGAVVHAIGRTLLDAVSGLAAGWGAAALGAACFTVFPALERVFMPPALALRSVPIVAILPLLTLLFGRGLLGTAAVIGIVVFFPSLVLMTQGLRSVSADLLAVSHVYNARSAQLLVKVRFPAALPAATASLRIAAPASLLGALLAEWMATGKGLGYLLLSDSTASNYTSLWSGAVLMTILAILVYSLTDALERGTIARFTPAHH
ncbi:ABC transporter permease subunit [Gordonia polyisoprenivorans]|uniref:ABC transporter permease n=1 Tax=Gordonia polyisoprenivorans TaxID=84595 RepID=UPI002234BDFD|nr:ABC transporter permease subunit [uncultured Gordonia sp.]UZF56997.1 ABC transporter permease subunit [Gordonia polyisoprenivorans]